MEVIVEQLGTTNNVLERQKFDSRTYRWDVPSTTT